VAGRDQGDRPRLRGAGDGVAFRRESPQLRAAFDRYLETIRADGTFRRLVEKYYPAVPDYFPEFFAQR